MGSVTSAVAAGFPGYGERPLSIGDGQASGPGSPPTTLTERLGAERRGELWSLLAAFVAAQRLQHPVRVSVDRNLEEIQAIDRLLAAARAAWEAEQDRRDTHGSKPVRLTIEAA